MLECWQPSRPNRLVGLVVRAPCARTALFPAQVRACTWTARRAGRWPARPPPDLRAPPVVRLQPRQPTSRASATVYHVHAPARAVLATTRRFLEQSLGMRNWPCGSGNRPPAHRYHAPSCHATVPLARPSWLAGQLCSILPLSCVELGHDPRPCPGARPRPAPSTWCLRRSSEVCARPWALLSSLARSWPCMRLGLARQTRCSQVLRTPLPWCARPTMAALASARSWTPRTILGQPCLYHAQLLACLWPGLDHAIAKASLVHAAPHRATPKVQVGG